MALRAKGGMCLAISVDPPEKSRVVVEESGLSFPILSDEGRSVIERYGLVHEGGGLNGETIAVPAQILVATDGTIRWRHVARRITARADPRDTLAAIARL